jgi:hypothetical protein
MFFIERIECRAALGRRRHQNPPPFGLDQRQRLSRRQRDPFEKRQAPLGARPRANLRHQPPRESA